MKLNKVKYSKFIWPVLIGLIIWVATPWRPAGLTAAAWHILAIFVATIIGCITQPLPIAGVAIIGITLSVLLK
ncbi:anion permease, partial [Lactobacillus sp. XV13L]|nr:anion permease [Lactobacillus sp. XV13L]